MTYIFGGLKNNNVEKINYNIEKYPFRDIISKILGCEEINKIHLTENFSDLIKKSVDETHKFQQSEYHQKYYNNFHLIKDIYTQFLLDVIKPLYGGENIVYQKTPTFRIHFPNGLSVGMFHKDKDLRDNDWHESIKEDNYYLPFTNAYETNTIWFETQEDKGDFIPMDCDYGQIIKWDGTNLSHGNKINTTEDTRISMDFRVAAYSNFKNSSNKTKNDKTSFSIGGYYEMI